MHRFPTWIVLLYWIAAFSESHASPCFEQSIEPTSAACREYVVSIAADVGSLRSLGRRLEIAGRYEQAAEMYRQVLPQYRDDKALQKGLIRVRRELRDRRILADLGGASGASSASAGPNAGADTPCWTLRWDAAVNACRDELASDSGNWLLAERYGDTLRSVGRPVTALKAYRSSLQINASNASLRKKHDILLELVDLEKVELTTAELPQLAATQSPPTTTKTPESHLPPVPAQRGRYRAIVFGNQNYSAFEDLESPIADANAISRVLREQYGFDVTTVIDATRYRIFEVLAELRKQSSGYDNVLIYYAGHGYLDTITKRGYWLPVDAEAANAANWISTSDITNLIAGLESKHALVIADSCFSGALTRSVAVDAQESRQALLKRLSSRRSRMILTSGGLEPVLDSGNPFSRHSVFADALLDALQNNNTIIEAGRLFVQVRDSVALASEQTPQYAPLRSAGHAGGDFLFVRQQSHAN